MMKAGSYTDAAPPVDLFIKFTTPNAPVKAIHCDIVKPRSKPVAVTAVYVTASAVSSHLAKCRLCCSGT